MDTFTGYSDMIRIVLKTALYTTQTNTDLFQDLDAKDRKREKVFLVLQIVRYGKLSADSTQK